MVVNMKQARLRVGLIKAAETARSFAALVKNPTNRRALLDRAERLAQRAKELPCE